LKPAPPYKVAGEVAEAAEALSKLEANSNSIAVLRINSAASVERNRSIGRSVPKVLGQFGSDITLLDYP